MYSTYFVNNKTYGADDINTVMARLTTQGVSLFNGGNDVLIDVNTAMSNLVSEGVQKYESDGCKVVKLSNGRFKISKGCCWMPSGACIIFDEDGYEFTPNFKTDTGSNSSSCYVYLRQGGDTSNEASNDINIIISGTAPQSDDVPLASISSSQAITDRRQLAEAKISVPARNLELTLTPGFGNFSKNSVNSKYETTVSHDVKKLGYRYAYDEAGMSGTDDGGEYYLCELTEEYKKVSTRTFNTSNTSGNTGAFIACHITLYMRKIGTTVYMCASSDAPPVSTIRYNLKLLIGEIQ